MDHPIHLTRLPARTARHVAEPGLLGSAFIALWNDVAPGREGEYDAWHTQEHVPQRVGIRGIMSGRRYVTADGGHDAPHYFTLYDLAGPEVLDSPEYRAVVQGPTPWSAAMRPSLQRFIRLPCRRVLSLGGGVGGAIATLRLPAEVAPRAEALQPCLAPLLDAGGVTAVHLGEPCQAGQPFPLGDPNTNGGNGLILLEGTSAVALRAALPLLCTGRLHGVRPALYTLAFLMAKPS